MADREDWKLCDGIALERHRWYPMWMVLGLVQNLLINGLGSFITAYFFVYVYEYCTCPT